MQKQKTVFTQSAGSVRSDMQSQDKFYSFLSNRVRGFFVGFHSGVMKERLVGFSFYKRAIPLPLDN